MHWRRPKGGGEFVSGSRNVRVTSNFRKLLPHCRTDVLEKSSLTLANTFSSSTDFYFYYFYFIYSQLLLRFMSDDENMHVLLILSYLSYCPLATRVRHYFIFAVRSALDFSSTSCHTALSSTSLIRQLKLRRCRTWRRPLYDDVLVTTVFAIRLIEFLNWIQFRKRNYSGDRSDCEKGANVSDSALSSTCAKVPFHSWP